MLIADSWQGAKEINPHLLESEAFRLLAAVDDCATLLLLLLLELCDEGAEVVVACDGAARGVSTWGTGCLLALKAAALMVYWWHWGVSILNHFETFWIFLSATLLVNHPGRETLHVGKKFWLEYFYMSSVGLHTQNLL